MMTLLGNKKFKIILIGDSNVGKTSLVSYFKNQKNIPNSTIGVEFFQKFNETYNHTLHIWDCAGQEKFRALTKMYYRNSEGCVLVFDLSNIESLYSIEKFWIKDILNQNLIMPILILVGNKSDLKIHTDYNLIKKLCKEYNMIYFETSIINVKNIKNIFDTLSYYLSNKEVPSIDKIVVSLNNNNNNNLISNLFSNC